MSKLSKFELVDLVQSNSPSVRLVNTTKICNNRPDIYQVEHNGTLLPNHVYCKRCNKVLILTNGNTGNLSRHCKSHNQIGSGLDEHDQAINYHFRKTNQILTKDMPKQSFIDDIGNQFDNDSPITSETLRSWKMNGLMPAEPEIAISHVIKTRLEDGIPMALVKWIDPKLPSYWIRTCDLKNYYIYDTDIVYEDATSEEDLKLRSRLSMQQKKALKHIRHRKRQHHTTI